MLHQPLPRASAEIIGTSRPATFFCDNSFAVNQSRFGHTPEVAPSSQGGDITATNEDTGVTGTKHHLRLYTTTATGMNADLNKCVIR